MGEPYDPVHFIDPGPEEESLFHDQANHRSEHIWQNPGQHRLLHCRRATTLPPYNELYTPHLRTVGLYGVHELVRMRLDHDLITALIERWRPGTHTFYMPEGECTVTLQDVNIISGLPINGRAITGMTSGQWIQMIYDFLGHQLDVGSTDIKCSQINAH